MSPRYDVPRAAPQPLRAVQVFVNSIDRHNELDWLDDWFAEHGPVAEPERARPLREAFRSLALANNGLPLDPAAVETLNVAASRLSLRVGDDGTVRFDDGGDPLDDLVAVAFAAMLDGSWRRLKACRNCRWSFYDASPNRSATWCSMQLCGNRAKTRTYRDSPESRVGSRACGRGRRSAASPSPPVRGGALRTSARSRSGRLPRTASGSRSSVCSRRRSS